MTKKYSNLLIKAKNGKKLSNLFYRFGKPFLIAAAAITFATVFIIHSVTFNEYSGNINKVYIYIFNHSVDDNEYVQNDLVKIKTYFKNNVVEYYNINNMNEDGYRVWNYYHLSDSYDHSWTAKDGRAVVCKPGVTYFIVRSIAYRHIVRASSYIGRY